MEREREREEREREKWRRLVEAFEWLEDHCWVLPPEEQAKAKLPARSPLTADELRRLMPGVPDTALAALVTRAQLIAHPDHWRPRLVVNNEQKAAGTLAKETRGAGYGRGKIKPRPKERNLADQGVDKNLVDASSSKLTAHQLREAIRLGVKMAEEAALFQLTMKAKQVAELDRQRRGLRLVWDRDQIEPPQV